MSRRVAHGFLDEGVLQILIVAIPFPPLHEFVQHQHQKQVTVGIITLNDFVCHAKQCFPVGVAVKQKTSVVFELVKGAANGYYIRAHSDRIKPRKVQKIIFVAGERLFIRVCWGSACLNLFPGGDTGGLLVEAAFHLFGKSVYNGIRTMVFTKFQGTPVSELVNSSICRRPCLVRNDISQEK